MTSRAACCFVASLIPALAAGQSASVSASERLSLDTAVRIALENNRQLQSARLQVARAEEQIAATRTRRLPTFQSELSASQLLSPVSFAFPAGAFGTFPATGPIPSSDTTVEVPRQPTYYLSSGITQPITQLIEIGLNIRSAATSRDIEQERLRGHELTIANAVKRTYFAILQTQSAIEAGNEALVLYRELDRTLDLRVVQKVALHADSMEVKVRLAEAELAQTTRRNALASHKEQLNQLLGRDVTTAFDVEAVASAMATLELDLEAARRRALENRPDVREAELSLRQAEINHRILRADRLPDVSLGVSYTSNFNMDILPSNMTTFGVKVTWEPFDWGRKKRELAASAHTIDQARLNVRELADLSVVEVNSRYRTLGEKRAALTVAQAAQRAAREKLRVKVNLYQAQAALLPDVLQLRAELADIDDRYQQSLLGFWTARADFEQALGEEVMR
jgi:outer membrane protein TolC